MRLVDVLHAFAVGDEEACSSILDDLGPSGIELLRAVLERLAEPRLVAFTARIEPARWN